MLNGLCITSILFGLVGCQAYDNKIVCLSLLLMCFSIINHYMHLSYYPVFIIDKCLAYTMFTFYFYLFIIYNKNIFVWIGFIVAFFATLFYWFYVKPNKYQPNDSNHAFFHVLSNLAILIFLLGSDQN